MTVTETEKPKRGRPRPEETIDRDRRALELIQANDGSITRNQLKEKLGGDVKLSQAYLSLWRLRSQGKLERVREGTDHVWKLRAS